MTKYQLEKGNELKANINALAEAHLMLSQKPLNSRIIPFVQLTEEINTAVKSIVLNDLENQIRELSKELEAL
jgi:hypothetical protein